MIWASYGGAMASEAAIVAQADLSGGGSIPPTDPSEDSGVSVLRPQVRPMIRPLLRALVQRGRRHGDR